MIGDAEMGRTGESLHQHAPSTPRRIRFIAGSGNYKTLLEVIL